MAIQLDCLIVKLNLSSTSSSRGVGRSLDRANKLNLFYNRFDTPAPAHPPSNSAAVGS